MREWGEGDGLEFLARLLEAVGSTAPLSAQLIDLALYVERLAPNMRCSILLVDAIEKTLTVAAAPHLPDAYNAAIDGVAYGEGVGSCGTAACAARHGGGCGYPTIPIVAGLQRAG